MTQHPSPGHISREKHSSKGYMPHSVHCDTVHNSQDMKQLKCPLTEERIKRCGTYTQWNITQVI